MINAATVIPMSLSGKVCIVTGAGSIQGIGFDSSSPIFAFFTSHATVKAFAQNGAAVIYITDISDDHLEPFANEIAAAYPAVTAIARRVDAASETDIKLLVADAIEQFGRLDVFFANAGVGGLVKSIEDMAAEEFMETLQVNTLSVFLAIKYAADAMQITGKNCKEASGGSIIATSSGSSSLEMVIRPRSCKWEVYIDCRVNPTFHCLYILVVAGLRASGASPDYAASKAAIVNLVQWASSYYTNKNIRINAVCPGVIKTDMSKGLFQRGAEEALQSIVSNTPLHRYGTPNEVADFVLFLASNASAFINAQTLVIDGGLSSRLTPAL
ncbi:hypothetical protein BC937DRAFT_92251 [Endogone sp. FLAS-F59071]|nr:hypothetical protein BC937DRAFT_92251 [Endogone sp. FLAS-F59071]|eukprot:RUS15596.1 hypothetical protein BC937DRAFT_92251 [Endogone sp. FLAS-F59071]